MADQSAERLQHLKLFEGLPQATLDEIEKRSIWHSCEAGEEILSRNSDSMDVYCVVEGSVRVVNFSLTGREIAYATLHKGEFFGELSAIDHKTRSSSVISAEKSLLISIDPGQFEQLILTHPHMGLRVMKRLASVIRNTDERIMDLSTLSAHQRLFGEILRLCEPDPVSRGRWQIYPMPTQHSMASLIGTTRETVARALGELTSCGIVHRKGRTLYIDNKDRLSELTQALSN